MAAGMTGSRGTPIYGPEPWRTTANAVWSHWDLWFCVVALADHDGDLDALAAAIEGAGRAFWSGTVEAKLSHLDEPRRRLSDAGIHAAALAGGAEDDVRVRSKARTKIPKQGFYPRDLTDAMRETPRDPLYQRALRGRWHRFPVSPGPFYERLAHGLGEGCLAKGATFHLERRIEAARDRLHRQTANHPAARLAAQRALVSWVLRGNRTLHDAYGVIGQLAQEALLSYSKLPFAPTGIGRSGLVRRPLRTTRVGGLGPALPPRDAAFRADPRHARRPSRSVPARARHRAARPASATRGRPGTRERRLPPRRRRPAEALRPGRRPPGHRSLDADRGARAGRDRTRPARPTCSQPPTAPAGNATTCASAASSSSARHQPRSKPTARPHGLGEHPESPR